jgi:uncharacterized linocin/CFP29 family protein
MPYIESGGAQIGNFNEIGGSSTVASKLLRNNMNVECLRTNETLLHEEWLTIDQAVIKAAQLRQVGIADLRSRGLVHTVPNGLAKTVLGYQDMSDIDPASISMDGLTRGERDRPEYDLAYLPLPIIHKDFSFSAREVAEARAGGQPLDTTMASMAAMKVTELVEQYYFQGSSTFTYGGGTIYGLEDAPQRTTRSLGTDWASDTAANILTDVRNMKQDLINDRHYGPYILYVPTAYEVVLDKDYDVSGSSLLTIRERILRLSGIQDVKVSDQLTAANVVLVQQTPDVVRLVEGLPITTVQWETEGGMKLNFKVMTIQVPQVRNDQQNRSGVCHLS